MKILNIVRPNLDESTRRQGVLINGVVYSLHIADDEVIITDNRDYSKIYQISSLEFFKIISSED